VKSNFYHHLQEFKDFMRQWRQSGDTSKSFTPGAMAGNNIMVNTVQWQNQGFPSAEAANLVTTITNAATPPTTRNGCLMALVHSLAPPKPKDPHVNWPAQVVQETPVPAHLTLPESNKRSRQDSNYHMFSLWAQEWGVNAFNLVASEKGLSGGIHNYITISQNLPHVHLPIGPIAETPDDKGGQLMAMCDTG
jgi:hypothetical protein